MFTFFEGIGASADSTTQRLETKIVGGAEATPNEYPWVARIEYRSGSLLCGGTIISENLVLTAAHCVSDMDASAIQVVAGEHDVRKPENTEQYRGIETKIVHAKYDR
jgi:secreted trypsin-like serine protease